MLLERPKLRLQQYASHHGWYPGVRLRAPGGVQGQITSTVGSRRQRPRKLLGLPILNALGALLHLYQHFMLLIWIFLIKTNKQTNQQQQQRLCLEKNKNGKIGLDSKLVASFESSFVFILFHHAATNRKLDGNYLKFLVSGRDLACQQEVSLALTKTPPIHYYNVVDSAFSNYPG